MKNWSAILIVIILLSACAQGQSQVQEKTIKLNGETNHLEKTNSRNPSALPKMDHIVIVIEENHATEQIIGNASAPYINSLVEQGAVLTNNHGIDRPSQPNYLDLFSGSNQGVSSNDVPKSKFSTDNLGSQLIQKKLTFIGYSEDLPFVGFDGKKSGHYVRKHVPWVNFSNLPKEVNQPLDNFPKDFSQLPTVSFIIPNQQNNMHDGSIEDADKWLREHTENFVEWAEKNNSLLIITWDEDNGSEGNKIPTIFVGPMVNSGEKIGENFNHFNLLRTVEEIYGLEYLGESKSVKPIMNIWR